MHCETTNPPGLSITAGPPRHGGRLINETQLVRSPIDLRHPGARQKWRPFVCQTTGAVARHAIGTKMLLGWSNTHQRSSYRRWWLRDPAFGYAQRFCSKVQWRSMRYPYWPDGNESLAVT